MILENVTADWRCKCGQVRRVDVTDVTATVAAFRPPGWIIDRGEVKCDLCTTKVTVTDPHTNVTTIVQGQHVRTADDLREQMSGLHIGGGGGGEAVDDHGIRQSPQWHRANPATGEDMLTDHEGKPLPIMGPGGSGIMSEGRPMPTYGASGGGADARPGATVSAGGGGQGASGTWGAQAVPQPQVDTKEFRPGGGNVAFVDTRNSEFLGPEKIIAGVPSLTEKCIGCHMVIQDGTTSGTSEAWRLANDSTFERGHPHCLAKIGR